MTGERWHRVEAPVPVETSPDALARIEQNLIRAAVLVVERQAQWIPLGQTRVHTERRGNMLYVIVDVAYLQAGASRPGRRGTLANA